MVHHRFLLITYPIQGHINPALQFSKRLIALGVHVTLATTVYLHRRLTKNPTAIPDLTYATFSDGHDDGYNANGDADVISYMSELKRRGSESLKNIITAAEKKGQPFTCVAHTLLLPWASKVARELNLPSALLWIQAATVFDIYYNYLRDDDERGESVIQKLSSGSLELPGLPFSFKPRDLPSFLLPNNTYAFALPSFKEEFEELQVEAHPRVLVNTFEELEAEALRAVDDKFKMIPMGPLIPSAFLDGRDPSDTSFGGDLFSAASGDYIEWLESKAEKSVVYVSFGTLAVLKKKQMEELARALLDCGFSFLWVIREKENEEKVELERREEVERVGKIVKWCSQVEVLSHRSVGCFVTHCGWNSTMESLGSGVPVVAFPQWTDQGTNAKLIEDVWRTGVRVDCEVSDEEGVVRGEEIRRCLEAVMGGGEKCEELRRNAEKWKGLARNAVKEGGSSDKNLRSFLDGFGGVCGRVMNEKEIE